MKRIITILLLLIGPVALFSQRCLPPLPARTQVVPPDPLNSRLTNLNKSNHNVFVISIRKVKSSGAVQYTAFTGNATPLYSGNNYDQLLSSVSSDKVAGKKIYYDLIGFSENDEMSLNASISMRRPVEEPITWRREIYDEEFQNAYLSQLGIVEDVNISPIKGTTRMGRQFYEVVLDYLSKSKRHFVDLLSSSKAAVTDFAISARGRLLSSSSYHQSAADVLTSIQQDIKSKYSLDKKDILMRFRREEFSQSIIVDYTPFYGHLVHVSYPRKTCLRA